MFDGVKLRIQGRDQQRLKSHHLLNWKPNGVDRLGRERFTAKWGAFTFQGDATRCTLMKGSFHMHHHGGENWADFTRAHFAEVVASVCIGLGLHFANLRLANLEVGVNIVPPIPTLDVLRCIVLHRTQRPDRMKEPAIGLQIQHAAYRFKIYDKARQYDRPGELLRFEVAARKMRTLERYGVRTLADLLEPRTWTALQGYLLARFDELLIVEPNLHAEGLRPAERELLARASDPNYWVGLTKGQRSEKRATLARIYTRHASPNLKTTLRELIASKLQELTSDLERFAEVANLTFAPTGEEVTPGVSEGPKLTFALHVIKGAKVRGEGSNEEVRRCPVCGRDITHQDLRSQVCSERLYGKDGKRCRNTLSNRKLTLRRMAVRSSPLFDQTPFIRTPGPLAYRNTSPHT